MQSRCHRRCQGRHHQASFHHHQTYHTNQTYRQHAHWKRHSRLVAVNQHVVRVIHKQLLLGEDEEKQGLVRGVKHEEQNETKQRNTSRNTS